MQEQLAVLKARLEKLKKMIDVPAVYADEKTSGLGLTVQSGEQTFDLNPKKP